MSKQGKLEITAVPTVLKALGRLNSAFCYAVYRTGSTCPQYAWDCELVQVYGCPFGCVASGTLKNKL